MRLRKRRLAALGAALVITVFASGMPSWPDQRRGMRHASKQDEIFRYLAQELSEPVLCEKIPWSVITPGGFFIDESYERSNCYTFIAGRTRNPWICRHVWRYGAVSLLSDQTSMWSCIGGAWRGMNAGIAVLDVDLEPFLVTSGYDPKFLDELSGQTGERRATAQRQFVARVTSVKTAN